jgi:DNA-binding CsgD family transcriptional regulator
MLLGREHERHEIEVALASARSGASAALVLVGEPGIGKTSLLDHAADSARGMQVLRARGVESEAQIPFAALLELTRPALGMLERIPPPQAAALGAALALRPAHAEDRFAVGAATLSLLAAFAEQGPVAVLVDDAQWVDEPSSQALLFAFRRLLADPIAVLIAVREGEPSVLAAADLPSVRLGGLTSAQAAALLPGLAPRVAERLQQATGGNPLAMLELAPEADEFEFAPAGAPVLMPATISGAFLRRAARLGEDTRRALVLVATSDTGDLRTLELAAARLEIDLSALGAAEGAGLVTLRSGTFEFRHVLARSAIYAQATVDERRAAHRALASALPDRDIDRRAWHLAAAAVGTDASASLALEQAGRRASARGAYASADAAFERAARLSTGDDRRAKLLLAAAQASWDSGRASRALGLLEEARTATDDGDLLVAVDQLAGRIATRRGPVMRGHEILISAAERSAPEPAVVLLAEATFACFVAGNTAEMLSAAERARATLPADASARCRFLAAAALGMARILGGDGAAGAVEIRAAIDLAERSAELRADLQLLPWLAMAPIFLRESRAGRALLEEAIAAARARAALSALPWVLLLIARDQATTDRWTLAEASYREGVELARESDQRTELVFGLSGFAWLQARRGREEQCRAFAEEALALSVELGTGVGGIWATAALGELELGGGHAGEALEHFERQRSMLADLGITDVDLDPAVELVDAYVRLGEVDRARPLSAEFRSVAEAKAQPWALARAFRAEGIVAQDGGYVTAFEAALKHHAQTPDEFERARTQLAYGERLRRERNRVLAREQLRDALETFEHLGAHPWADRARAELAATGETLRRRDPSTIDELTPQELQIALLLAAGKTTREAAAALFLSPKTIEYHLRHVYLKLDIHSRDELARAVEELP